jgi:hypothetical protein
MRRAAKKDVNHKELAEAFKSYGFTVADTSRLGDDFPDMVVGKMGFNILVEVKRDAKAKLTDGQFQFFHHWKGWTEVVRSIDDVQKIDRMVQQEKLYQMRGFITMNNMQMNDVQQLAKDLLDPERHGLSVTEEVRDQARATLGIPPVIHTKSLPGIPDGTYRKID